MDLKCKSITWVGNVYQKFEAMCLEVEDMMCQETAKYMETQVQNVGASVKKFYAEVVQDILPPSSDHPIKNEGSNLPLEQNADFGTYEKSEITTKEDTKKKNPPIHDPYLASVVKSSVQERKDEVDIPKVLKAGIAEHPMKEKPPPFKTSEVITQAGKYANGELLCEVADGKSHLLASTAVNPVKMVGSLEQIEKIVGIRKKIDVPTKEGSMRENQPSLEVSDKNASAEKGASQAPSFSRLNNEKYGNACTTPIDTLPPTLEIPPCNSPRKTGTTCNYLMDEVVIADSSCVPPAFSFVLPTVSRESIVADIGLSTSSSNLSNGITVSQKESSREDHERYSAVAKLENYISAPEIGSHGKSDDDSSEMGDIIDTAELRVGAIEEFQNAKLEESCIVVDSKELQFIPPHKVGKQRSYKKKIRNAFASRMRSAKEQEYKQLAVWHGDAGSQRFSPSPPFTRDFQLPSHDSCESEWELL